MNTPTQQQNAWAVADARRYATVQALPITPHADALREVMHASERAAHLSQGYTPEESTLTWMRLALMCVGGLGIWALFGYVLAPAVAWFLVFLGVFA